MPEFDELLAERTARGSSTIHGCITAAVDKNGKELFYKALGYNGTGPDAPPIDPNATFWIASCTKLIGTIAALQCVERGQITLDEPVGHILPELANPEVINKGPDGAYDPAFSTTPATKKITLRHLLTHSAGLGYDAFNPTLLAWRQSRGEHPTSLNGTVIEGHSAPLLNEPGEGWVYSGGIDWAGLLVARLNKTTLEEYLQENVFKPLGMTSTTFRLEKREDIKERLLTTVQRTEDGSLKDSAKIWPDHAAEDCAGAGLYTRVSDYLQVLKDLIKDEPMLLKKETIEGEMFCPQFTQGCRSMEGLLGSTDMVAAMTGTSSFDGVNWGLGGIYAEGDVGAMPKGTLTWGGLPNLVWFANREKGVAAFFATQVIPPGDKAIASLVGEISQVAFRLASSQST